MTYPDALPASLGPHAAAVEARLGRWEEEGAVARLWGGDHTLWSSGPDPGIAGRLGWMGLPDTLASGIPAFEAFAAGVAADGIGRVVLLGMGGSSLAPEVFARTFGGRPGYPILQVLDSTHPATVAAVDEQADPASTLFVVSSKSGTTIEPLSFLHHCWARVAAVSPEPGRHFAAITDPGTALASLARERGFRRVFEAPADVGGRFSALTPFGLVPAALIGSDLGGWVAPVRAMAEACRRPPRANPGFVMGAILGELARAGRDKATFLVSPGLAALPAWIEQLVAESTGKHGTGIVPVAGEPAGPPGAYGDDRLFVYLSLEGEADDAQAAAVRTLEGSGHPVVRLKVSGLSSLGAEMYRAEVAVAMAGSVLGINPFDQPDVQLAKELASRAMAGEGEGGPIQAVPAADPEALGTAVAAFLSGARVGDYLAVQAFVAQTPKAEAALQGLRLALRDRGRIATTVGFGPRFLHSTGQLHKGGPATGLFLQVVDRAAPDLPVPGEAYTFARLVRAQADGDYRALASRGRRVMRVDLDGDPVGGLAALEEAASL
jgi:transaldolase/glucose-6-phosphate isomerase